MFTYFTDRPKHSQKKSGNDNPHEKCCVRLVGQMEGLNGPAGGNDPAIPHSNHGYTDADGCGKKYPFNHNKKECSRYA